MAWFVSSDQHLGHLRALEIMPHRPWTTVDDMTHGLIDNHNDTVGPDDHCIFLGDVVMGKKFENVPKYLPMLNGTKYLVPGNHDFLPSELKADKLTQLEDLYLRHGITQIVYGHPLLSAFTGDSKHDNIMLCHFPTTDTIDPRLNEYEQRYTYLRPTVPDGMYLLHGHTHSRNHLTTNNQIHVGVDAEAWNYRPVALTTILNLIKADFLQRADDATD